ncbi:MAG: autotransporter domain-containing protein [Methylophilaceae bacterium]
MKIKLIVIAVSTAIAAWAPMANAREAVALPGVVGAEGVLNGVDTAGVGTLTINANQNINTNNDAGGAITSTAADTASILFNGNSTVTGTSGTVGSQLLSISAGAAGSQVNFNGDVFAQTISVSSTGTINFNGDVIAATNFAGNGLINLGAGNSLTGAVTTNTANTGRLTLNAGSSVTGAVGGANGLSQINVAGGNASIVGSVQAQNFNLGANNLLVVGALTTNPGGTISTTLSSNTVFGKITPSGASNINAGGITVAPTVTGVVTTGTNFRIVDGLAGTNAATVNVINTSPLYRFVGIATTTGDVNIRAELATFASPAANAAGQAAFAVNAAPGSDLLSVQNSIFVLPNAATINSALAQFSPNSTNLAAPWVAGQATRQFDDLWIARVDDVQNTYCDYKNTPELSKRECKNSEQKSNWWGKGFGGQSRQDNSAFQNGYQTETAGLMVAYDVAVGSKTRIGLGGGYANSNINENHASGKTNIDSYQMTAYLKHNEGPWFVQGAVTAGVDKYDGSRNIVFPGFNRTANSNFTGQQYSGMVMAGKHFYANEIILTPLVSLQATHLQVNSYTEKDAGDINLRVDSQDYNFLQSGLGMKVERPIQSGNNTFSPEVHAKWLHDFNSTTMEQTTRFTGGGASFDSQGIKQDRDLYNVGAGLTFISCRCDINTWAVKGLYDYKWNDSEYTAHQLSLVASLKF